MKKLLFILGIIFAILTFIGAIANKGTVNTGYVVIPCVWTLICMNGYRWYKNKK